MSFPTAVNSQITDSVTPAATPTSVSGSVVDAVTVANTKVLAEAPAMAMGSVYQSLAHATGILFENAVSQQHQQGILAQAATTQGIIQIYSVDTFAGDDAAHKLAHSSKEAVDGLRKAVGVNPQIVDAVNISMHNNLLHSGDVTYGIRAAADALGAAIERVNRANGEMRLQLIKQAAIAACLAGMVRDPDKAGAYEAVLESVKKLGW
jgi:hypothetical protein